MKKFNFLVGHGYKKRVKSKAFIISNIVIALIVIALINLPILIDMFTSPSEEAEVLNVYIINEINNDETLIAKFDELLNPEQENKSFNVMALDKDEFDSESFWTNEEQDIVIYLAGTINSPEVGMYNKHKYLDNILQNQVELLLISYLIDDYQKPLFIFFEQPGSEITENAMALNAISTFLIVPLFVLIILAIQFVGVDIIEEKSSKAIEIIISSVPAKMHFFSKITASILFILTQGGLLIAYLGLASLIANALPTQATGGETMTLLGYIAELIPNWPVVVIFAVLFVIVGTLFYLVIGSLLAAMATSQEDYQQFQTPIMLILLAGFYIGLFAPMAGAITFLKIMAFIPVFSPIVAPISFVLGAMSIVEVIIAFVVLVLFFAVFTYLVAPVYRVAILSYEQTKFFARIKSYFKKVLQKPNKNKKISLFVGFWTQYSR